MSLHADIFTLLKADDSATAALCGAGAACRVYDGQAPATAALPYVVVSLVTAEEEMTHDRAADLEQTILQFSCVDITAARARNVRAALRADLRDAGLGDAFTATAGFSEATDQHLSLLDVTFWNQPAQPA